MVPERLHGVKRAAHPHPGVVFGPCLGLLASKKPRFLIDPLWSG
jgi:hypothetical protein